MMERTLHNLPPDIIRMLICLSRPSLFGELRKISTLWNTLILEYIASCNQKHRPIDRISIRRKWDITRWEFRVTLECAKKNAFFYLDMQDIPAIASTQRNFMGRYVNSFVIYDNLLENLLPSTIKHLEFNQMEAALGNLKCTSINSILQHIDIDKTYNCSDFIDTVRGSRDDIVARCRWYKTRGFDRGIAICEYPAVVIDNGSTVRSGLAFDAVPSFVFPSVIGRVRKSLYGKGMIGENMRSEFVGDEAQERRGILTFESPINRGTITNIDQMENIWEYIFTKKLLIDPSDHAFLITEPPLNPRSKREQTTRLMFEKFGASGLYVANTAVLSMFASGGSTGVVFESGEGASHIVPIYEGYAVHNSIQKLEIGGRDVNDQLAKLLCERGYYFNTRSELKIVQDIKEELAYVAFDFDYEMESARKHRFREQSFSIPDAEDIVLDNERFRCAEILFQPSLHGVNSNGVHECFAHAISKCDINIHKDLYANIVLSGGTTKLSGMANRLRNELYSLDVPHEINITPSNSIHSAWSGGASLASLTTFDQMVITKADYDEAGPCIVHRRCF